MDCGGLYVCSEGMRWGVVDFWWRDERRKWFSPSWDIRRASVVAGGGGHGGAFPLV